MSSVTETLLDNERYTITYNHRSRDERMGRFGGGWQWKVGAQWGSTTIILNLLFASVRIQRKNPTS